MQTCLGLRDRALLSRQGGTCQCALIFCAVHLRPQVTGQQQAAHGYQYGAAPTQLRCTGTCPLPMPQHTTIQVSVYMSGAGE